jgi:broad specificity phosphatase PhoE
VSPAAGTADVLLRHGETAWNAAARFQGQHDTALSERGLQQAAEAAVPVAAALAGRRVRLVTSDLERAARTAAAVADATGVEPVADPRLREVAAGAWQGLLQPEIRALDPEAFAAWRSGGDVRLGGAERPSEAGARVAAALREHVRALEAAGSDGDDPPPAPSEDRSAPGCVLAVGHGASVRAGVAHLLGLPDLRGSLVPLGNTACAVLERTADGRERWRLRGWNVPPHALAAVLAPGGSAPATVT